MKTIILVSLVVALLAIGGCTFNRVENTSIQPTQSPITTSVTTTVTSTVTTTETKFNTIKPSPVDFWAAPAKIEIANLSGGDLVDTFQADIVFDNGYKYEKDKPLCLFIYNGTDHDVIYDISLDTGDYGQPQSYGQWISISNTNPVVTPKNIEIIPFSIKVPADISEVNKVWEFRINVMPRSNSNIVIAASIRVIVSME